jgi:hypothetical protein
MGWFLATGRAGEARVRLEHMHNVQAIIANRLALTPKLADFRHAVLFPLTSELALLPITDEFAHEIRGYRVEAGASVEPPVSSLSPGLALFAKEVSRSTAVAYIATFYVGGLGGQDAVVWENEQLVFGPTDERYNDVWPNSAISQALRKLGIVAAEGEDEFDTVGLGRYRATHRWAEAVENG